MRGKPFYWLVALAVGIGLGLSALAGFAPAAQMDAIGIKVVGYDTATAGDADALIAAPSSDRNIVVYGFEATCETAAAFTVTLVEDAAGTPATIGVWGGPSASNVSAYFVNGLLVTAGDSITATGTTCGGGVDGHVTIWGQVERQRQR